MTLAWDLPKDPGRPAVADYELRYRVGEIGRWRNWPHTGAHRTATVTGLHSHF